MLTPCLGPNIARLPTPCETHHPLVARVQSPRTSLGRLWAKKVVESGRALGRPDPQEACLVVEADYHQAARVGRALESALELD